MKKSVSILILALFLFSGTELHQLLKLPVLINHYIEHRNSDSKTTFWAFINMHYSENGMKGSLDQNHKKLPFKDNNCGLNHSLLAEALFIPSSILIVTPSLKEKTFKLKENFYYSFLPTSIWQPPKSA